MNANVEQVKEQPVRIENWTLIPSPAFWTVHLSGDIINHPKHAAENDVVTSAVLGVSGRQVQTRGALYELGEPAAKYKDGLKEHGFEYRPDDPLYFLSANLNKVGAELVGRVKQPATI